MNKEFEENKEEIQQEALETEEVAEETTEVDEIEEIDPVAEANDKYLRLVAEFDNFKKRTLKEKSQIYTSAAADVIEAILPLIDNLGRATSVSVEGEEAKSLLEGVKLVERQLMEALTNLGVEEIKAVGEKFDPNIHNAVMHVDDETIDGEEVVVEEFMKGYIYKDKVIRHSTVKVAN